MRHIKGFSFSGYKVVWLLQKVVKNIRRKDELII
jgi:hypothetical protein